MTNQELFDRAQNVIPGGVSSPVRAYGSVGGTPPFIASARGAWVTDVEGRRYADLVGSWGPALLGHAHPAVIDAVQAAVPDGLSFGAPTEGEIKLAELICDRIAVEKVRFVSTGTEATMTAIRLARGFTGRDLIIKFAGCYHGHEDPLLVAAGSGVATFGMASSAGVPAGTVADTVVVDYNDRAAITQLFDERGSDIAAIITEAAPANMGVVSPDPGFNRFLLDTAHKHGALLIFDEVLTGFRVSKTGYWGIENATDPEFVPDIFTFGKVIGGGMPIAALGGPAEVMDMLAPLGPVYQAGTLSGNPLATAAGFATLTLADDAVYSAIDQTSRIISDGVSNALTEAGVAHHVQRVGNLFSFLFGEHLATHGARNYTEVQSQEQFRYSPFFHSFLEQGVYLPPSVFEAWFVSSAHDEEAVEAILAAAPAAAQAAAQAEAQ